MWNYFVIIKICKICRIQLIRDGTFGVYSHNYMDRNGDKGFNTQGTSLAVKYNKHYIQALSCFKSVNAVLTSVQTGYNHYDPRVFTVHQLSHFPVKYECALIPNY